MKITLIDFFIIALYFAFTMAVGYFCGRGNKSTNQYFLAGGSFSGLVIGISFVGTLISSVTFIGIPADSFKTAWLRFVPNLAIPIVALMAARFFVPFFRRGTITSAYEYLALRFDGSVSFYAACAYIVTLLLRTSMIAYLLALLLGEIIGWGFYTSLLAIVGFTAVYTTKGGFTAVIWTDVIQTFVLVAAALACLVFIACSVPGGLGTIFTEALAHHKLSFAHDYDPATAALAPVAAGFSLSEKTALMLLLAGFVQYISVQLNQESVQRWCSAKSANDAKKSLYYMAAGCLPVWAFFQFLGTAIFVFFLYHPDAVAAGVLAGARKAESIMPYFISNHMPAGLKGLVIAGALAAAMSTLSSCINTTSMVLVRDIYHKLRRTPASDRHDLVLAKRLSIVIALMMIGGSIAIYLADTVTLTDMMLTLTAIIASGVPGIFLAGMLTRRASLRGAWAGLAASMFFVLWVKLSPLGWFPAALRLDVFSYYVAIIGNILSFGLAWLVGGRDRAKKEMNNLTVWNQGGAPLE